MNFSLLGPVAAWSEGQNLTARSRPQLRKVLSALLVDSGRLVTVDTLIWRVWESRPPGNARRTLHSHISRIRKIFSVPSPGADRSPRLLRHDAGYVLQADAGSIDAHAFQRMVEKARGLGPEECADLLEQALGLWKGEALAGLSGDWVEHRRERYRRMYSDATVSWAASVVESGRPHAAVDALTGLAEQNPLAEPVTAMLMRALHASGYTADALARFHRFRDELVEELGTDPGREIRELHTVILTGGPVVGGATAQAAPGVGLSPRGVGELQAPGRAGWT